MKEIKVKLKLVISCLLAVACAGWSPVTADDALAIAKKLCAPRISKKYGEGHWGVKDWDCDSVSDCWKVDGRYYLIPPPSVLAAVDLIVLVPKDGRQPKACDSLVN